MLKQTCRGALVSLVTLAVLPACNATGDNASGAEADSEGSRDFSWAHLPLSGLAFRTPERVIATMIDDQTTEDRRQFSLCLEDLGYEGNENATSAASGAQSIVNAPLHPADVAAAERDGLNVVNGMQVLESARAEWATCMSNAGYGVTSVGQLRDVIFSSSDREQRSAASTDERVRIDVEVFERERLAARSVVECDETAFGPVMKQWAAAEQEWMDSNVDSLNEVPEFQKYLWASNLEI